jgi:hypothetical protein
MLRPHFCSPAGRNGRGEGRALSGRRSRDPARFASDNLRRHKIRPPRKQLGQPNADITVFAKIAIIAHWKSCLPHSLRTSRARDPKIGFAKLRVLQIVRVATLGAILRDEPTFHALNENCRCLATFGQDATGNPQRKQLPDLSNCRIKRKFLHASRNNSSAKVLTL